MLASHSFLYKKPIEKIPAGEYHHKKNIIHAAAKIFIKLRKHTEVICCAEMQSGKTNMVKRLIYIVNNCNNKLQELDIDILKHNIYLIICTSSLNLKTHIKLHLPEIKHHIYHLNDIIKFLKNLYEYDSVIQNMVDSGLIIFDECHCDAEYKKTMDKIRMIMDKFAEKNKTTYYKVGISATPYEQIFTGYPKIIMKPSKNYYGLKQMFESAIPVIFQAKNLEDLAQCDDLFTEISVCDYYYIFRLPGRKNIADLVITNIEKQFRRAKFDIDTYIYDMQDTGNINDLLSLPPGKPTIIYLKDKLRMGEYLNTEHVYLVHDDPSNTYTHTTAQSLVGRCCGYHKKRHRTIIYCDYEKAVQHYNWIEHNYDINYIPIDAKYIKKDGSGTKPKCIYQNVD